MLSHDFMEDLMFKHNIIITATFLLLATTSVEANTTIEYFKNNSTIGIDAGINRNNGHDKFIFGNHVRTDLNNYVGFELGYTNFPDNEPASGYSDWWALTTMADLHAPFWLNSTCFIQVGTALNNMDQPSGDYYSYIRPAVGGGIRYPINDKIQATAKARYFEYAESLGIGSHTYTLTAGIDYRL